MKKMGIEEFVRKYPLKREWSIQHRSSDGIIIDEEKVVIDNKKFSHEEFKDHINKCRAVERKLKSLYKK